MKNYFELSFLTNVNNSIFFQNLVMVYLKMGIMRSDEEECAKLLPKFFVAIKENLSDEKNSEQ